MPIAHETNLYLDGMAFISREDEKKKGGIYQNAISACLFAMVIQFV